MALDRNATIADHVTKHKSSINEISQRLDSMDASVKAIQAMVSEHENSPDGALGAINGFHSNVQDAYNLKRDILDYNRYL